MIFIGTLCSCLFIGLRGLRIENEDIILLPRSNGKNFTLNIQNSPLKEKFYNFTFQQNSQVNLFDNYSFKYILTTQYNLQNSI